MNRFTILDLRFWIAAARIRYSCGNPKSNIEHRTSVAEAAP